MEMNYHNPVLLKETVDGLNIKPDGVYVDVTFGGGGHSREILSRLGENGRLFAFDQDKDALNNAIDDPRFTLINQNFRYLKNYLRFYGVKQVDGVLGDLGVSSHQFDEADRGFSIRFDGDLDMRMDQTAALSAKEVVNDYEEADLRRLLFQYGELKNASKVARSIVAARPLQTSAELKELIQSLAPRKKENKFLAQVYQAIRIEVNQEIQVLKEFLEQSASVLNIEGRLSVISYHSLEDRLVKRFMKTGLFEGEPEKDFYGNVDVPFKVITRKVIVPSKEEIQINNRARSARLRIAEKIRDE